MLRRARWGGLAILLGIFGGRGGPNPARADDAPKASAPAPEEPLLWQWFDVGAITAGRTDFWGESPDDDGPFPARPNVPVGADFSSGGEEFTHPFGSRADVIDLVRSNTPSDAWERDHVLLSDLDWPRLGAYAPRSLLDRIEAFLLDLEADAMLTVTLDAIVVRGDPATGVDAAGQANGLAGRALEPLVGVRTTGMLGQVVMGRTGGEQAHVADQDVGVFIESKGSEPIVCVLRSGLAVRVRTSSATPTRIRGMLRAWWTAPARLSTHRGAAGEIVERPDVEGRSWNVGLDLEPGVWTVLPSTGGISLAVRATVKAHPRSLHGPAPLVPAPLFSHRGPRVPHRWAIGDLAEPVVHARGSSDLRLVPSIAFTPSEPPELPNDSAFPVYTLVDTLHLLIDPAAFIDDHATLDIRNETLWGSIDDGSARIVDAALAAIRARSLATTHLRGTVLSLPLAAFPEFLAGLDDGALLLQGGEEALLRRPGAQVVDRCALRLRPWQRDAVVGGSMHPYVGEFRVEQAEKVVIGKPVQRAWLEGLSLDVRAHRSLAGDAVWCEMLLHRSTARGTRSVSTPYGALDCPSIGVQRAAGAFALPFGASRIVAVHLEDGVVTLVILGAAKE